jgi:formylglycine-generating enzyme required for sulfatase activity
MTTEVTVEQFLRFRREHNIPFRYTPEPDCPVTHLTWYEAAKYCRWLDEQEGVPEDQMCYPPIDQIGPPAPPDRPFMKLPADFLQRTGHRLPTEAEWEYACRAGAATGRFYGHADELLGRYARTFTNSGHRGVFRSAPVGGLLPNDFGLFDVLGNAMELCHDRFAPYPHFPGRVLPHVLEKGDRFDVKDIKNDSRVRRGGAFLYEPSTARSAHRDYGLPNSRQPFLGFRVVRTVR